MNNEALRSEIAMNTLAVRDLAATLRLQTRQWWTVAQLVDRWGMGEHRVVSTLNAHGVVVGRGKRYRVQVDDVLRIDEALRQSSGS